MVLELLVLVQEGLELLDLELEVLDMVPEQVVLVQEGLELLDLELEELDMVPEQVQVLDLEQGVLAMVLEELDMVQEVLDMVLELLAMVVLEVVPEFLFTLLKGLEVQLLVTSMVNYSLVKRNQFISKYMT